MNKPTYMNNKPWHYNFSEVSNSFHSPDHLRAIMALFIAQILVIVLFILHQHSIVFEASYYDHLAMRHLNFRGSSATDHFWYTVSKLRTWIPLGIVAAGSLVFYSKENWQKKITLILTITALICFADQFSSSVIKPMVARIRPSHDPDIAYLLHYVHNYHGGLHGFVSSHAANVCCIVSILCLTFRNRIAQLFFVAFAMMICYSRIYLGVHFPLDIMGGAIIGITPVLFIHRFAWHRLGFFCTDKCPKWILAVMILTVLAVMAG